MDVATSVPDAAVDASVDGSVACNDIVNDAPLIEYVNVATSVPVGIGGTVMDGTYVLTRLAAYEGSPIYQKEDTPSARWIIRITGALMEFSSITNGVSSVSNFYFTTDGATPSFVSTCPNTPQNLGLIYTSYTAMMNRLDFFGAGLGVSVSFSRR